MMSSEQQVQTEDDLESCFDNFTIVQPPTIDETDNKPCNQQAELAMKPLKLNCHLLEMLSDMVTNISPNFTCLISKDQDEAIKSYIAQLQQQ